MLSTRAVFPSFGGASIESTPGTACAAIYQFI